MLHKDHQECFHSRSGALLEATDLYVNKSGIEGRLNAGEPLRVLDVGLGLGYNALATYQAWVRSGRKASIEVVSLEIDPELVSLFQSGTGPWQSNWSEESLRFARGEDPGFQHAVLVGDALDGALPHGLFDYIWQDPFSPSKNPTMWSREWFEVCRGLAAPDCVMMTYSVARSVRDAMTEAGWNPTRIPATGPTKRHWLQAKLSRLN